ncbi:MAG TPA: phage terminase small subunit P27 family [Gemmataceae bacterium]|nr:phage terminase small subunit P27 family [Gemmataceae bacterium]
MLARSDPLKTQILAGTFRAKPSPAPPCPDHLDALARAKWAELCQALDEAGRLSTADRDMMALYCAAYSQWREASEMVKKSGLVIKGRGGVCANPCVQIAANVRREMRELAGTLG